MPRRSKGGDFALIVTHLYVGTSGWSYASWKPRFYPPKLASGKFLGHYATRLDSVEVNYTFRRFPAERLLANWIDATPPGFRFAVKAHQTITHIKRLRECRESVERFMLSIKPLADAGKLGPVLFQMPRFVKCDPVLLGGFLEILPKELRAAFEFRHESWFCDEAFAMLRSADAALCEAESETIETPQMQTASFAYLRLRKPAYSVARRAELAREARRRLTNGDVFVYFKHEETPDGALYAEELRKSCPLS